MFTMFQRCLALLLFAWLFLGERSWAVGFLFDNSKDETAGNADWVLDADNGVVARIPTPAASGITSTTPETYWTGALSSWGVALVKLGQTVESLPTSGRITYLDSTNAQDLSKYQVYVVCEPNHLFTMPEKTAIIHFVQDGGSLFVISDHAGSDRDGDGYDSVQIWNDFFTNNGVIDNPFGVAINSTDISVTSKAVDTATNDPLTNGPQGAVTALEYSNGATITLNTTANSTVKAAFWQSTSHTNSNVMVAYGSFGAGRFAVICDSSPIDDGTGNSNNDLYTGWTEQSGNHSRLILNASLWLAAVRSSAVPANDAFASATVIANTGSAVSVAGSNVNATAENGEPALSADHRTVWWKWTAPSNLVVTVSTAGSNFDTVLGVYTGSAVNALTLIGSNDNFGSATSSQVSFLAKSGTVYLLCIDGNAANITGNISLALNTRPLPIVSLVATTASAAEKNQVPGVFTLSLNSASALPVSVAFGISGSATANVDYTAAPAVSAASITVTIPAGQTTGTCTITPLVDNDPMEGDETVVASLAAGSSYQINSAAASASIVIHDDSPYSAAWQNAWRSASFSGPAAAPTADFDGDGLSNFEEFAFNLNPIVADAITGLPILGSDLFTDATDNAAHRYATISFTRRTDAPNLTYIVEATGDLVTKNWSNNNAVFVSSSSTNMPPNTERAIYRTTLPEEGPDAVPRQFLRVRVVAAAQ